MLFEAPLIGLDDLVEPRNVVDLAGEHDLHDLARLASDLVAGLVPPLARGIEHGEPVREAGPDLAIDETAEVAFAHADPAADVAAEHQFGHLGRSLTAETIQQSPRSRPLERQSKQTGRGECN